MKTTIKITLLCTLICNLTACGPSYLSNDQGYRSSGMGYFSEYNNPARDRAYYDHGYGYQRHSKHSDHYYGPPGHNKPKYIGNQLGYGHRELPDYDDKENRKLRHQLEKEREKNEELRRKIKEKEHRNNSKHGGHASYDGQGNSKNRSDKRDRPNNWYLEQDTYRRD